MTVLPRARTFASEQYKLNPEPVGVIAVCCLILAFVGVVFLLSALANVLVPLVFAVFLAFLVEPLLSAIVLAPRRLSLRLRAGAQRCGCAETAVISGADASGRSVVKQKCSFVLESVWDGLSIILCVAMVCGFLAGLGWVIYQAFESFDWYSYSQSKKIKEIDRALMSVGINITDVSMDDIVKTYRGHVDVVATAFVGVISSIVTTVLLFVFCMVAFIPGIHKGTPRSRMQRLMQRYLVCKSISSAVIACAIMLALWLLDVPLFAVFGIITFLLNFIPNTGSLLSMLAPLPFVLFAPGKTLLDVGIAFLIPFAIHNSLGCAVDARVMQDGLSLHPLSIVISLVFWGFVWGVAGCVLSVPVTCCLKLWLEQIDHAYARTLKDMLESPFGSPSSEVVKTHGEATSTTASVEQEEVVALSPTAAALAACA
eukprot:TRINITY_DN22276_c0_g2_i1.p1 TRINITY_DN22276_c0_g2~~TRINITY_DN22276_c0_g2_i1.p1  ORF type:complete len:440 (+),score=91.16 TRINITY_DN22276_c0_g2_i1:41-1321(+)